MFNKAILPRVSFARHALFCSFSAAAKTSFFSNLAMSRIRFIQGGHSFELASGPPDVVYDGPHFFEASMTMVRINARAQLAAATTIYGSFLLRVLRCLSFLIVMGSIVRQHLAGVRKKLPDRKSRGGASSTYDELTTLPGESGGLPRASTSKIQLVPVNPKLVLRTRIALGLRERLSTGARAFKSEFQYEPAQGLAI